jgi:hypothetical protein
MRRQYILKMSNTLPVNKYCSGGGKVLFNIWLSRSVGKELSGTRYDIYDTLRLWLAL